MVRLIVRVMAVVILVFFLAPDSFSKNPAAKTRKASKKAEDATSPANTSEATKTDENAPPGADPAATAAFPPQATKSDKKASDEDYKPAPKFTPMLATTGTLGLFTAETADTLPKGGFDFSAYGNKFGRMPGSVTVLQFGLDLAYGATDRLNFSGSFVPHGHIHVGCGQQLSLAPPNRFNPFYQNTIFHEALTVPTPPCAGDIHTGFLFGSGAAGPTFVEDFPFAANNTGGPGYVTLGVKYALLSERLGDRVSLSARNDLNISTKTELSKLLANGTQGSPLSDLVSLALSKRWGNVIVGTFNFGYLFTRDPRDDSGNKLFRVPDQLRVSAGYLMFPESRIQPMAEYTGVVFTNGQIPNTTYGARDPVDSVFGVRLYPVKQVGIDVGYRYMLNLRDLNDRYGFVVKVGTAWWPEKPAPVNHPPTISCSADKNMVYVDSGDTITINCNASDPDNDPLTYTWSSTCGKVDGTGSQVRWLSAGTKVGSCTITAKVDDGRGGYASSSVDVRVEPKPNRPPVVTCSADRTSVFPGERIHITTNASDPDGDPITYAWRATGGEIVGSGPAVDLDTTGAAPGRYMVTVRVDDGRGGSAECSASVEVKPVPPPPQASKIGNCTFGRQLSARVDNVCKRVLDDAALRLQNEPRSSAVIIGYSDPKERTPGRRGATPEKVAGDRAANAAKYLGEKGIDSSRVTTRTASGQVGATDNRRADIIFVPQGATY